MDQISEKNKDQDNKIIKYILLTIFLIFVISCNSVTMLGYYILNIPNNIEQSIDDLNDLSYINKPRKYIDPLIDSEAEYLLQRSSNNFHLSYQDPDSEEDLKQYEDFVLVNLEQSYEELAVKFSKTIPEPIEIVITDDQDWYEIEFGFDYDDEIPYGGLTTYRRILVLIADDISNYKNDFSEILKHELVHVFQFEAFSDQLVTYPKWFLEGTAEYFSGAQHISAYHYPEANLFNNLDRLSDTFESGDLYETSAAYVVSFEFISFLVSKYGEEKVLDLMLNERQYLNEDYKIADFNELFIEFFGQDCNSLYENWYYLKIFRSDLEFDSHLIKIPCIQDGYNIIVYNSKFLENIELGWRNWHTRMA